MTLAPQSGIPTSRGEDPERLDALNARIGTVLGESPSYVWRVMTGDESAYCIEFTREDCANPEREATGWLADFEARHPAYAAQSGYHVVKRACWPDYLGEGRDALRFVDWALRRSPLAATGTVVQSCAERVTILSVTPGGRIAAPLAAGATLPLALLAALDVLGVLQPDRTSLPAPSTAG
jgi:hypothetical protein